MIAARYLWVRELVIRRSGIKWAQSLPCRPQTSCDKMRVAPQTATFGVAAAARRSLRYLALCSLF